MTQPPYPGPGSPHQPGQQHPGPAPQHAGGPPPGHGPPAGQVPPSGQGRGPVMPNGRPRPGAPAGQGPGSGPAPRYVDYGNPRAYDTSMRPAPGLTAARYAPAPLHPPQQAQPASAWSTQTRRVQEVAQAKAVVPKVSIAAWIIVTVLAIALLLVLGFFFVLFAMGNTGGSGTLIWWPATAFLALVSLLVIAGVMLLADRWDPQPIPLLLIAIFWGAAIATFISFWVNTFVGMIAYDISGSMRTSDIVGAVFSAPLVEETTKGLGLVLLLLVGRRYFNGPLDGLIYGALIGGGFAFTENILYYSSIATEYGAQGVVTLFIMRGVLNIFGHAIYTSMTGVIMGYVVRRWGTLPGVLVIVVALIPGILLHAGWNLGASLMTGGLAMLAQFGVKALLSLCWLILIGILVWDEARLTRVRLGDYANMGWLTHEEVDMLATWKGRREGRRWAAQIGQKPVMKRFIRESADLASVRQRLLADGAAPKAVAQEAALLQRLSLNRQALLQAA